MKKIINLFIFSILISSTCFAISENSTINLQQAINIALETNPQLKMKEIETQTSKNDIKTATSLKNPSIYTTHNMGYFGASEPQQVGAEYLVEILKRKKRKDLAKSINISTLNSQKFYEQNLIFEVKKAYIDLLLKKSNLKILLEQEKLAKDVLKNSKEEFNKGNINNTDVIQAKIALNRSIMYTNMAKSEVIFAQNHFNSVMNTSEINYDTQEEHLSNDYNALMTLNPQNETITFEKIKDFTLKNRYDLKSAQQDVQSAENNLKVVKSKLIPDMQFIGGYLFQTHKMADNNSTNQGAFAGVKLVDIPLINQYKPEIKNAQLEIEKAQLKYEDLKTDIIRNITDAWEKYTIAKENLNFYNQELLQNSKDLLLTSMENLNKKEINLTTFLVSKKLYLELILAYYEALGEYYTSYAELIKEIGINDFNIENI